MVKKHNPKKTLAPIIRQSEKEFNEGLKVLLQEHSTSQLDALARWPGELTDPDFAKTKDALGQSLAEKNERLLEELRKRFAEEKLNLDDIAKGD